jgi:phospholipid/cholesterol/gamma-HCH transport system substrate-binding protein
MKKYSMETIVGIFVVIGLLCVGYMAVKLGKISLLGDDTYVLYARFTSVSGLKIGSPVEILGLPVGKIENLEMDPEKQMVLVRLRIKKGVKVYDDASASIKTAGLIGDKFVKIDPGGSGSLLKPEGVITETTSALDLEDLIGRYAFGEIKKDAQRGKEDKK